MTSGQQRAETPMKTGQNIKWTKYNETPSSYMPWNNSPLEKISMARAGNRTWDLISVNRLKKSLLIYQRHHFRPVLVARAPRYCSWLHAAIQIIWYKQIKIHNRNSLKENHIIKSENIIFMTLYCTYSMNKKIDWINLIWSHSTQIGLVCMYLCNQRADAF